jgi:hypothetical protein
MFDSEGNALLVRKPRGEHSWDRRVAFYSTEPRTLDRTAAYLLDLGIPTQRAVRPHSKGHLGTKQVEELKVAPGREHYARFAETVGSSIRRKAVVLDALAASYVDDMSAHRRSMQAQGVAVRRLRRDAGGRY